MSELSGTRGRAHPNASLVLRACGFLVAFAVLQLGWQALRGSSVERLVIEDIVLRPAAMLVHVLTPEVHAQPIGSTLRAAGGGLNILNGCEGTEALFLLIAAFVVAPLSTRSRLYGILLGIPIVFAINEARILALFYAFRADHELFDSLHSLVTPILVVLLIAGYFHAWISAAQTRAVSTA